ncbi:hypothetical protein C3L33_07449, partial [Rhododendron williamsianum]
MFTRSNYDYNSLNRRDNKGEYDYVDAMSRSSRKNHRPVSEAAKQSLKKKGMHFPPWRKAEYVKAKWLSPFTRTSPTLDTTSPKSDRETEKEEPLIATSEGRVFSPVETDHDETVFALSESSGEEEMTTSVKKWEPPETIRPKSSHTGVKIVTGLASIIEDKP